MSVTILLFLPLLAALAISFIKNESAKYVALFFAVAELALSVYYLTHFVANSSIQFAVDAPWIPQLGIYFSAGIDGINIIPVILTTLMVPIIILTTFKHTYDRPNAFYALILFMQTGLLVVFTAFDGFLFYVGWEAALIPWLSICIMAPCTPFTFQAKIAAAIKPTWAMDE